MKKIVFLMFLGIVLFSCNKKNEEISPECMNPPAELFIFIVNEGSSDVPDVVEKSSGIPNLLREFHESKEKITLYKLAEDKKKEVTATTVRARNGDILIASAGSSLGEELLTQKLQTFYIEYGNRTDTLKIKGGYFEHKCGDGFTIDEIHLNSKKTDSIKRIFSDLIIIDNYSSTDNISDK